MEDVSYSEIVEAVKDYIKAVSNNEGVSFIKDIENKRSREIIQSCYDKIDWSKAA